MDTTVIHRAVRMPWISTGMVMYAATIDQSIFAFAMARASQIRKASTSAAPIHRETCLRGTTVNSSAAIPASARGGAVPGVPVLMSRPFVAA